MQLIFFNKFWSLLLSLLVQSVASRLISYVIVKSKRLDSFALVLACCDEMPCKV